MEVSDKLSKLLSKTNQQSQLDKKLATSCQQFFTQSIAFRPASGPDSHLENLKARYKPLNRGIPMEDTSVPMEISHCKDDEASSSSPISTKVTNPQTLDVLPTPRRILYSSDKLDMKWKLTRAIGSGLCNMGNTCFLNSVLQCLTYTPPLYNYLMSGDHKQSCGIQGFCTMCEFQRHCTRVFNSGNGYMKPVPIVQNLRAIAKHFRLGRQEDAHEFLRYFIDGLQKSCLHGYPAKLDPHSKATTVVHQIFGGYHRSQVKCLQCMKTSNTYDPLLDVSLDIKNCNTILKALMKSIKPDLLEGDNSYACPFCKKMTKAQKRFTLQKLPKVLTVQLKRFNFNSMFGSKVNKNVDFPEHIDMRHYMSNTQGPNEWYKLFAVLVHYGFSSHSGHYYCYIRNSNGIWYCMNDSQVTQVSFSTVLQQEAYLLFYIKDESYSPPGGKTVPPSSGKLATKSHDQQKAGNVKHDPNFLSTTKKQSGLDKTGTPFVRRLHKPTGIVPPSPKIIPDLPTRPKERKASSPPLLSSNKTNGSVVQEFSIPLRKAAIVVPSEKVKVESKVIADSQELPEGMVSKSDNTKMSAVSPSPVFVPRQIGAQGKLKKTHRVGSKVVRRETLSRKLSPLLEAEEEEMDVVKSSDSSADAIPLASSITPLENLKEMPPVFQPTATAERTILDFATSSPATQTVLQSPDQGTTDHRFIGPLFQPPPPSGIKMDEDYSTSTKVALVSPHSHTGRVLGSGSKPVARVRPSPHVTTTPDHSLNKDIETTPTSAKATSTVVTTKPNDIKSDQETQPKPTIPLPSLSSPQVDSTTSGDVIVSPPGNVYGPDLPSDHVTSTLGVDSLFPNSSKPVSFKFGSSSKHSKKHKKKKYREHSELEGVSPSKGEKGVSSSARSTDNKLPSSKRISDSEDFVKSSKQSRSSHHRDKHPYDKGDATHSHHKHKKHYRGDSDEIDKTPPEDRRGKHHRGDSDKFVRTPPEDRRARDREAIDRHSKNRKSSSIPKFRRREYSRYKYSRSRSPLSRSHSRRSRSNSPGYESHRRRHPPYTTPRKYSHRHRRHSHMSSSSGERVKRCARSRSRSPYYRRHQRVKVYSSDESGGERVKESPVQQESVFTSPDSDLSKKQKRKRERQSEEKRPSSPEHKRHKSESLAKDSIDKQHSNSTQSDVPVIVWDAPSKSDLVGNKWDGARQSDSLEQLTSRSNSKIGVVKSWDGGENSIDACTSQKEGGQKWTRANWDTELDKGKVKKVKRKITEDFNSLNKFQEVQTKKNSQIFTVTNSPDKHRHHKPHNHHKGHKGHHYH